MAELNNRAVSDVQAVEVALAMLERDGCWLMQLRDDIPGIVAPGCWGLFGGHLDPGETAEQALQRELLEEIGWQAELLHYAMEHRNPRRRAHVFCGQLTVPLAQLQLLEGQDMARCRRRNCSAARSGAQGCRATVPWRLDWQR